VIDSLLTPILNDYVEVSDHILGTRKHPRHSSGGRLFDRVQADVRATGTLTGFPMAVDVG
jgi:hypothetical protein